MSGKTWRVGNDQDLVVARNLATFGDAILLADGTYSTHPVPANSGRQGAPIRVIGNEAHRDRVRVMGEDVLTDFVSIESLTCDRGPTLALVGRRVDAPTQYSALRNCDLVLGSNASGHLAYCVHDHCQIGNRALRKGTFGVESLGSGANRYHQVLNCTMDLYAALGGNGTKGMTAAGIGLPPGNFPVSNLSMVENVITFNKTAPAGCVEGVNQDGSGWFCYDVDNSSFINNQLRFVDVTGCAIDRVAIEFRNGCTGNTFAGGWIDMDDHYRLYFSAAGSGAYNGNNRWLNMLIRSRSRAAGSIIAQAGLHACELSLVRFECAPGAAAPFDLPTEVDAATSLNGVTIAADRPGLNFTPAGTARLNGVRYLPAVP